MNKMARVVIAAVVVVVGALTTLADSWIDWTTSGSHTVGKSSKVTMPEGGVAYLKLSGMKVGKNYTFVATGSSAGVDVVYTYTDEGDLMEDDLAQGQDDIKTPGQNRCFVDYESWVYAYIVIEDPEDKEWKVTPKGYFLRVTGDEGAVISISSQTGIVEESIPLGDPDNPQEIKPTASPSTSKANFIDGAYYFTAKVVAGGKYLFSTSGGTNDEPVDLSFDGGTAVYSDEDVSEIVCTDGNAAVLLTVTSTGTVEFHVGGSGTSFGLVSQSANEGALGRVTVTTKGTEGLWSIKGAAGQHESGETVAILGTQTIVFSRVNGFSTPANMTATPTESKPDVTLVGVYNDTYDPKDDTVAGATKISPSAKVTSAARTLFAEDEADHFVFTAKEGVYYNFELLDYEGDAKIEVFKKGDATQTILAGPETEIRRFAPGKGDYIVRVSHADEESETDAQYSLAYSSANVGSISFAKTSVTAKKSAGYVSLTVNRSAGEGKVRVRYGTVNDEARPGVDYVAQSGELEWEDGDKKAKTITIKLLPELFAEEAVSRDFMVQLKAVDPDELGEDEYLAAFAEGKDEATVTLTEAKAKAPTAVKPATVKTEMVALESGTYQGVIAEDGSALTNGFPALASVTFTAKNGTTKKALSAKVTLAGKTYTFSADTWDEDESDDTTAVAVMTLNQTVNKVIYENTLRISVVRGATATGGDWLKSAASVELTMNVPDANNKGVQEEIVYSGELFRDNAKIQDYLYAVTNAVGYYTIALTPSGVMPDDGIPAGNGYLTLTIDNKGKVKIAGMLADGTTKPSYSSIVAVRDAGDELLVPVFVAKSPYCFGGTLKLVRGADGKFVVDSTEPLIWNNDNALLTYDGEEGWRIALDPVGGYFNTVNNLQAYYLTSSFSVSTADVEELPEELLTSGYSFITSVQPNGYPVSVVGNTMATDKKSMVRDGGVYDLENSINPCNVQVKLTRATGLVTGSFSSWSDNEDGKQKELTGFKHYGVLLLSRDEAAPLDLDVMTAGFCTAPAATIKYTVTDAKGKTTSKTRKYTASMPFNILAVDEGEPDWYADDWGDRPEE